MPKVKAIFEGTITSEGKKSLGSAIGNNKSFVELLAKKTI